MYKLNKYPDGASYISETTSAPITLRLNSYEDLWHLNQYIDAFISEHGFEPNVIIPNLIDAQADRRFNQGESSGLKLVCNFLNSLPVKKYFIFHPHNPEVVEALIDNVKIVDNRKFILDVLTDLNVFDQSIDENGDYTNSDNLILMSADAGGYKPLMKLCDQINWKGSTYSASKSRKYDNGKTTLTQKLNILDFKGKDILIIDDIAVYGGTFKGLATLLRERNVGKLYLAVSHITIQNHKPNPNTQGDKPLFSYFDKVFTTNSKFDNYFVPFKKKNGGVMPKNLTISKQFFTRI